MRRLTILLATVGALLLVPAAQAFANPSAFVSIEGTGSGEVSSVGGSYTSEVEGLGEGTPPIECAYKSPGPASGSCETELEEVEEETYLLYVNAIPAPGSTLSEYAVEVEGGVYIGATSGKFFSCLPGEGCNILSFGEEVNVTAVFTKTGPSGPTNRATLSLTKSPSSSAGTGIGSVSSKPKGIKCGTACDSAVASLYKESSVELTAKASTGSTFKEWTGACTGASPVCTVKMTEDKEVEAIFAGTSKTIASPTPLTVSKGESTGYGTVKAAGLGCEADCTSTTVLYQGPIGGPKPKTAKSVTLSAAAAFGSKFTGWSGGGCSGTGTCTVTMNEATTVTAEFEDLPDKVLTINKTYAEGTGSVSSKPKGIKCGTTCTSQSASMPEGASVELVAKGSSGAFVKWVNPGGDCNESASPTCIATMDKDETIKAVFSGTPKAIPSAKALTVNKAGSGYGTIKASGLACEVLCTSATSLYQGPITEPRAKPAKAVTLVAISAPGSKAVQWTGCESNPSPSECTVTMNSDTTVTATFDELE